MGQRMFTAIHPPSEIVQTLGELVEPRRGIDENLRFTAERLWHVTLAFMPDVTADCEDRIDEMLAETAQTIAPFDIELAGGGAFPNAAEAKVLYLGIGAGRDEVIRLQRRARNVANNAGTRVASTDPVPHLTIARTGRQAINATKWLQILDAFPPLRWRVEEISLVASHRGHGPTWHEVLGTHRLTGRD